MKNTLCEILISIGIAILVFFGLHFTIQNNIIVGSSMEPGLHNGQWLIVVKAAYFFGEPQRGDVVTIHMPGEKLPLIKRIIAIPGDTVEIRNSTVYVNGKALQEPYIKEAPRYSYSKTIVPLDNYFVLGDNRNISRDSHTGFTIPRQDILGRASFSTWPPNDIGLVDNYPLSEQMATP
ncbi:MAG: signal peptidase I [Dehalococcoidales bacterium]